MFGDGSELTSRTAGEQDLDPFRHASNQLAVFFAPSHRIARASNRAVFGVLQTLPLSFLQRRAFDQDALSLVALFGPG